MAHALEKINWQQFKLKNEHQTKSFEELCYHLFCRRYRVAEGIRTDYNQTGLETFPILFNGQLIGFQAKFFENPLSHFSSKNQLNDSLKKAKNKYGGLKKIIIFTHQSFGSDDPKYKTEIERKVAPIEIEWFMESKFQAVLFQPRNLDLTQLYFGQGNEMSFIKNSISNQIRTFLLSSSYLHLNFTDHLDKPVKKLKHHILNSTFCTFMLAGSPGSGKSISMYKLFQELGGLDKSSDTMLRKVIIDQNAIPMLINLRHCVSESIENIIRGRQTENNIGGKSLNFIYLFDGLDELTEQIADNVLTYISDLAQKNNTAKIIFSCRSGNLNRIKAKVYFKSIQEIKIAPLESSQIDLYFNNKGNPEKIKLLVEMRILNPDLVSDIHDILLLELFWETIDEINSSSNITDLLTKKIELLLNSPRHKKHLEGLNLLDPKEIQILDLQDDIAYRFNKDYQFRFEQKDLQELIIDRFNYKENHSVNRLVHYLSDLFFEQVYADNKHIRTYIFQHRRYQEYFFARKLVTLYENHPKILRELNVISKPDFFQDFFLPFLRKKYRTEMNLIGMIDLNLLDVYLGKNSGGGPDDPYYLDSNRFVIAVACQNDFVYEQLLNSEGLSIRDKLNVRKKEFEEIKKLLRQYQEDPKDYKSEEKLRETWEKKLPRLIDLQARLHQFNRIDTAKEVMERMEEIFQLYDKHKFVKIYYGKDKYNRLDDPYFKSIESHFYNELVVKSNNPLERLERIRKHYTNFHDPGYYTGKEEGKQKLVKSFLRTLLCYLRQSLTAIVHSLDEYEFISLSEILTEPKFLSLFYRDKDFKTAYLNKIKSDFKGKVSKNMNILFFKKISGLQLLDEEQKYIETEHSTLKKKNEVDLYREAKVKDFVLSAYVLDKYSFPAFFDSYRADYNYYYELGIYATVYYHYVHILENGDDFQLIVRDYLKYVKLFTRHASSPRHLLKEFSELWAVIFSGSSLEKDKLKKLKKLITAAYRNVDGFIFDVTLKELNAEMAANLVTLSDLIRYKERTLTAHIDFGEYIGTCFNLSMLYSNINDTEAIDLIAKGINDGILRHGWRKDPIVSYNLVDALEILWRNSSLNKKTLKGYTKKVFNLTRRVTKITDGKITWRGPYRVVNVVAKYDVDYAKKIAEKIKWEYGHYDISLDTTLITGKIDSGISYADVEKDIAEYDKKYTHERKLKREYNIERFRSYVHAANHLLYSEDEQRNAFDNAYNEITTLIKNGEYISWENEFSDERPQYKLLCKKYRKTFNMPEDERKDTDKERDATAGESARLMADLSKVTTVRQLSGWFKRLSNKKYGVLGKISAWKLVVRKSLETDGSIDLLLAQFKKEYFPSSDYFGINTGFYHLGVAACLQNINSRQQILTYLSEHSGHGGFVHIMESYEALGDESMCIALFERFLKLCEFLVE